jgi:hypothetical protein
MRDDRVAGSILGRQSNAILARSCEAHRGNYTDDVNGKAALGCREDELRDLFSAVRA